MMSEQATTTGLKLLLVGDQESRSPLRKSLEQNGYFIAEASTARDAASYALAASPDLVVLAPSLSGEEITAAGQQFRGDPLLESTLLLAISAGEEEETLLSGLNAGIDFYLQRPVSPSLLAAYIRGLFRFSRRMRKGRDVIAAPDLRIDRSRYVVVAYEGDKAKKVELPHRQFELLHFLASRPGEVFTRKELLQRIWENPDVKIRTVDVHIQKIRTQIGERYIHTVNGVGYKFMEYAARNVVEAP